MAEPNCVAVIMAGGSGTRFWPKSRKTLPKQYLNLFSSRSLIQETERRISPLLGPKGLYVCTGESQRRLVEEHISEPNLILEPSARNTAPCLMLSAYHLLKEGHNPNTVMVVLPADHHVADEEGFQKLIRHGLDFARRSQGLVTLGISPTHPHSGYGYIEAGEAVEDGVAKAKRFLEKPSREKAEQLLRSGNHYWNSGIFIWTLKAITDAFTQFLPEAWETLHTTNLAQAYEQLPVLPIDVAVLEKATNVFVLPANIGWSDIGSWGALYDLLEKNAQDNVLRSGDVQSIQSRGCIVDVPAGKRVALVGVKDLIVVETDNEILIAARDQDQLVREAAKSFES